jgi:hypothetical protein
LRDNVTSFYIHQTAPLNTLYQPFLLILPCLNFTVDMTFGVL